MWQVYKCSLKEILVYVNFKKKIFKMKSDATMCLIIYISLQPNL